MREAAPGREDLNLRPVAAATALQLLVQLIQRGQKFTSGREDLNLRPRGPKPRALPS